jgi:hypothetical protein
MSTSTIPVRAEVAWLCALAVGLGYSAKPDGVCVHELITGARGSAAALQEAHESLRELAVIDVATRQRTSRLLQLAWHMANDRRVDMRARR